MLRADRETKNTRTSSEAALISQLSAVLPTVDALILSDYAKGVITPSVAAQIIKMARASGKPVIVDPKNADLSIYDGATVVTPNRHEAQQATGIDPDNDLACEKAASAILMTIPASDAVLVTRGAEGMTLVQRNQVQAHLPAIARRIFDVTGAGDTVIAAFTSPWHLARR